MKFYIVCILLLFAPILVEAQLNANFSANTTVGCNPMVVQFTNLSTGNPTSYSWNFGNGNTSTLSNPSATYTNPGTYTVSLTISNSTGSNTKTLTNYITVYPPPVVEFTANDTAGCPPLTVSFTDQSVLNSPGAGTYAWNFGTGVNVATQNPIYTFQTSGYFNITHVVISSVGCTTTLQKTAYIHVFTPPVADFSTPYPVLCGVGNTITFTNLSTGTGTLTSEWNFGDGGTSTSTSPSHMYNAIGNYTVTLITTDANGCKDTLVKPNYIHVVPQIATFTSDSIACAGATLNFSNTTPFTVYCHWNFGDGSSLDTNQNTTHTYNIPGTYTVTLTVNNGTCMLFGSRTIVIHPNPSVDFVANIQTPCPAPTQVQFTNLTTNGGNYTWDFGDGTTSTQVSPNHIYQSNGVYNVTLTCTNSFGCSASIIKPAYISIYGMSLTIHAIPGNGCIPLTDTFYANLYAGGGSAGGQNPYPGTITSYQWTFGDGSSSSLDTPIHTYIDTGIYHVHLLITTSNGCSDSAEIIVKSGTHPTADFTASPLVNCVHQPIYFQNNSSNANSYQWFFGDGGISLSTDPTKSYDDPGIYTVSLVASFNGCNDTLTKNDYIKINYPKANFSPTYLCDTLTKIQFTNSSLMGTSFLWNFGDGTSDTATNPIHNYPGPGTYNAQLIAYNDTTGCTDTFAVPLTLIKPIVTFNADDTTVCLYQPVTFTAFSLDSNLIIHYAWLKDGILMPYIDKVVTWTYSSSGWKTISLLTVDIHGCIDTFTKHNYVIVGDPQVHFKVNDSTLCAPSTVTFTSTTTYPGNTYGSYFQWSFGNGLSSASSSSSASTTYTAVGIYDVQLWVTDNIGCVDSFKHYGYINVHDPHALFNVNTTNACVGVPIPFFSQSQGSLLTYLWNFGDGTTDTSVIPHHIYSQAGTYTVSLIIKDDFGCTDTLVKPNYITVNLRPTASFSLSDTFNICPPLLVQANNTSTGASVYNWDMGDGSTNTAFNPINIYVNPGVYTIRLIAINANGCRDTAYAHATLLGYNGAFTYSPLTGCAPLTVNFQAAVQNVPGFVWDFSDGTTIATTNTTISHTYTHPGSVVPRLIMTDNQGCSSTSYGLDTIKVDGIYSGFTYVPYPACDSGWFNFTDTSHGTYSTVVSHLWTFHDGQTSTIINPTKYYPAPGSYIVKLYTSTNTGCRDTLIDSMRVYTSPIINAGPDTTICLGDYAILHPSGGITYTWSPTATLSCANCSNPQASPTTPTNYVVIGTDNHGCKNKDSVLVNIKTKTVSVVGQGGEICEGESIQLLASGAQTYEWIPGTWLNNNHIANPVSTPQSSIIYTVIAREGSCIPDTNTVSVIVHPKPDVNAGPDQTIIAGDVAQINATGTNITTYEWIPSNTLSCSNCADPAATPQNTTTYKVIVISDFGCQDSDKITIFVLCDQSQVYMPNSFTPNGDGENDRFYPRGKGIKIIKSFRIYNRWGELLFEQKDMNTNDKNRGWDGTYKGVKLNPDVFVYIVDAICDTGEPVSWKGDITIIR